MIIITARRSSHS